jgi:hypothetical protein
VIEINVDEDQIEDRVDEALQYYQEYHGDAVVRRLLKRKVTNADITNGYIEIANAGYLSINNVFSVDNSHESSIFSADYQLHLNDIFDLNSVGQAYGGIAHYEMTKQYMSLIDRNINGMFEMIEWSRHKSRVIFHSDTLKDMKDLYIVFDGYTVIDPDDGFTKVYNDAFLKKYTTALIKRQWGLNLIKFEGMTLPGGVTLNGRQIFDDAKEEIQMLEETMQLKHEMPPLDFIG